MIIQKPTLKDRTADAPRQPGTMLHNLIFPTSVLKRHSSLRYTFTLLRNIVDNNILALVLCFSDGHVLHDFRLETLLMDDCDLSNDHVQRITLYQKPDTVSICLSLCNIAIQTCYL